MFAQSTLAVEQKQVDVEQIIAANETTIALAFAVDVQIEVWDKPLIGVPAGTAEALTAVFRWSKQDNIERFRNTDFLTSDRGKRETRHLDVFQDGNERRILIGWNPDDPPSITPVDQQGVDAMIEPRTGQVGAYVGHCGLMLLFYYRDPTQAGEIMTYRELWKRSASVSVDSQSVVRFLQERKGDYVEVAFDRNHGMLATSVVIHKANYEWPGQGAIPWAEWRFHVDAFQDYGDGVYIPKSSRMEVAHARHSGLTSLTRFLVKETRVNSAFPKDALDFRFPEDVAVKYPVDPTGQRKVVLWGANNRPGQEIRGPSDLINASTLGAKRYWPLRAIVLLLAGSAALTLLVMYVVRRTRA